MDEWNINYDICTQNVVPVIGFLFNWKETPYLLVGWNQRKNANSYIVNPGKNGTSQTF